MPVWNVPVTIDALLAAAQRDSLLHAINRDRRCPAIGCVGEEGSGLFASLGVEAESGGQAQDVALRVVADALAAVSVEAGARAGDVFDIEQRRRRVRVDFDGLIVDLDGVVWVGPTSIPGSVGAIAQLRADGVQILFLTNDPRRSRADYATRLNRMGIEAAETDIVSSGSALAALIYEQQGGRKTGFVIGSPSLKVELSRVIDVLDSETGLAAHVVAVGGHDGFNYEELRVATHAVRNGAQLYAAGRDATFPMPDGPWPGTGSIVAAVEFAAGTRAIAAGKPEAYIFNIARSLLVDCRRIAVVGDNVEADIAGGVRAGLQTILVLTGTTSQEDLAQRRSIRTSSYQTSPLWRSSVAQDIAEDFGGIQLSLLEPTLGSVDHSRRPRRSDRCLTGAVVVGG